MMQFAARGALQVPPDENIEILVHLARHNKVFGDLARMTLAGWDEKASLAAASNPNTAQEVLNYMISPENLRPKLLPALLENPSVNEVELAKFARSATRESIEAMLGSARVKKAAGVLRALKSNPYVKKNEGEQIDKILSGASEPAQEPPAAPTPEAARAPAPSPDAATTEAAAPGAEAQAEAAPRAEPISAVPASAQPGVTEEGSEVPEETVSAYLSEHAAEIAAEGEKPFQSIGGALELLGPDYFPVTEVQEAPEPAAAPVAAPSAAASAASAASARPAVQAKPIATKKPGQHVDPKRENTLQKINSLDVKGRIQLALKGNKEERSILIRDGTKVVALAVLEAPKLSDGEVEKFASQRNVLEAVLRSIPLKRRFVKNYIVVRNLVFNPRTPIDQALGLIKNLLVQDLKNLSANKEVPDTIRKLGLKMYKQKLETANKK